MGPQYCAAGFRSPQADEPIERGTVGQQRAGMDDAASAELKNALGERKRDVSVLVDQDKPLARSFSPFGPRLSPRPHDSRRT
jgi:hypothetical protein